jgi:GNAT superfamily N-acetyltransferase
MSEWVMGEYVISTDKSRIDREKVHQFLASDSYWAVDIPYRAVDQAIEHSMCFGIYTKDGSELAGFARVISDHVRFAYLADLFIVPEHRGKGLSKWLVRTIIEYPDFQGVHFCLGTKDAHTLYQQYGGFKLLEDNKTWMIIERDLETVYKRFA